MDFHLVHLLQIEQVVLKVVKLQCLLPLFLSICIHLINPLKLIYFFGPFRHPEVGQGTHLGVDESVSKDELL
jgi:hypothetical protein